MDVPKWSDMNVRRAIDAAGVSLMSWNVDTYLVTLDACGREMWGVPGKEHISFEDLSAKIHPTDRDRVRAAFAATRGIIGEYEIDFRIMVDSDIRWISARGRGDDEGIVARTMYGIFLDVTGRKYAEEAHELLAGEMSHRVKNLLAIASGLTKITARSAESIEDMATDLSQRLSALGRAHDLVRPAPGENVKAALLGDLLTILLAPYDEQGDFAGRIRVSVPRLAVGEAAATTLAMVMHELATNSLKYGTLKSPVGILDVSCTVTDDDIVITWTERGGPAVTAPANPAGFGSMLMRRSMTAQLGGSIEHDWAEHGLVVTLRASKERLAQ